MSNVNNNEGVLSYIATVGAGNASSGSSRSGSSSSGSTHSWLDAFARAWGGALDGQANRITELSDAIGNAGDDMPSQLIMLTTQSQRFGIISQNASTSMNSLAEGMNKVASKQ